jgi:hypothetical protein
LNPWIPASIFNAAKIGGNRGDTINRQERFAGNLDGFINRFGVFGSDLYFKDNVVFHGGCFFPFFFVSLF